MDIWTSILDLTSRFVTPVWNELVQYVPLLLIGLIAAIVLGVAVMWRRNLALNRSRVPLPLPAGPAPAGLHLPGPSPWPFVAPVGLFLVFLGLILGGDGGANLLLIAVGFLIASLAAVGWFLDAGHEYVSVEAGDDHLRLAEETEGREPVLRIPEGIHLPGPSAWPFLVPVGLFFVFVGLVLGPPLILAGAVMAAIALAGWYLDAGREYEQVEAGHVPEPATRDGERAFPKRLMPLYFAVGGLAVLLTLSPWLLTLLPTAADGTEQAVESGPAVTTTPYVSASSATAFDVTTIVVPADTPFTITFENKQAGVPHNIHIYASPEKTAKVFEGANVTGPATIEYEVPALGAGEYPFVCSLHPPMTGTVIAK